MGGPERDAETALYGRFRRGGGGLLILAAVALALIDAASAAYQVDPIVLGLLLGTGSVLLGVDAGKALLRR